MTTVAILEDQRLLRDALADALTQQGFTVTCATGEPEEMLGSIRAQPTALALIDLLLRGDREGSSARGLDVLRELRRWVPEVKTVVISGALDPALMEEAHQEGAVAYLDKTQSSLLQVSSTLRRVLAGERLFPVASTLAPAARQENPVLSGLTVREREVLREVATGADNLKIAGRLGISERTVRAHISALYRKLQSDNRTQLALMARKVGMVGEAH